MYPVTRPALVLSPRIARPYLFAVLHAVLSRHPTFPKCVCFVLRIGWEVALNFILLYMVRHAHVASGI